MIKLTGAEAQRYADHQLEDNNARGYVPSKWFRTASLAVLK